MKKSHKKLNILMAGVVLSFAAIKAESAQAAIITDDFTVNVTSGSLAGSKGSGCFSYDDSKLTGKGTEEISVSSLLFNFLGTSYTQNDDYFASDGFPEVEFNNGMLVGLNYTVNYNSNSFFYISGSPYIYYDTSGGNTFYEGVLGSNDDLSVAGTVTYITANSVPEPSST